MAVLSAPDLSKEFEQFFAHWNALGKHERAGVPLKSVFKPMAMTSLLPDMGLMEYQGLDVLTARVVGTNLDSILGKNITNENLFSFFKEDEKPLYNSFYDNIATHPVGGVLTRNITDSSGTQISVQSIVLPMCDDDGRIIYVLTLYDTSIMNSALFTSFSKFHNFSGMSHAWLDIGFGVPDTSV